MYKLNSGFLPKVLCNVLKKNKEIQYYYTTAKDIFCISHESQTFFAVGAKIWNALSITIMYHWLSIKSH